MASFSNFLRLGVKPFQPALVNAMKPQVRCFGLSTNKLLKVQQQAPAFRGTAVVDGQFKEVSLKDYQGKYLVMLFYPLDFTFVCPTEIIAFSDRMREFKSINTNVVGCSCDSHFCHLAWINTPRKEGGVGPVNLPLLSDFNKNIAKAYDILLPETGVPLRGMFIIDPKGIIRHITVNDLQVGRSVLEALRLVKAFQFTDQNPDVCAPDTGEVPGGKGGRQVAQKAEKPKAGSKK